MLNGKAVGLGVCGNCRCGRAACWRMGWGGGRCDGLELARRADTRRLCAVVDLESLEESIGAKACRLW